MAINKSWLNPANLPPINAANFPSLKHCWLCRQSDIGTYQLTDAMGNGHLTFSSLAIEAAQVNKIAAPVAPDGASIFTNNTAAQFGYSAISGALVSPGSNPFVLMTVGKFSTAGFVLGLEGGNGAISAAAGQTVALFDGANTLDAAAGAFTASANVYGRAMACDFTNLYNYETDGISVNSAKTPVALSTATPAAITAIGGLSPSWLCSDALVTNLYMAALWVFPVGKLPKDIPSALAWMTMRATMGDEYKAPYPGWIAL